MILFDPSQYFWSVPRFGGESERGETLRQVPSYSTDIAMKTLEEELSGKFGRSVKKEDVSPYRIMRGWDGMDLPIYLKKRPKWAPIFTVAFWFREMGTRLFQGRLVKY